MNTVDKSWEGGVRQRIEDLGKLVHIYEEGEHSFRFSVRKVEPYGWATLPIQLDYKLFADAEVSKDNEAIETHTGLDLGSCLSNATSGGLLKSGMPSRGDRPTVTRMGIRYFEDTSKILSNVVAEAYKEAMGIDREGNDTFH